MSTPRVASPPTPGPAFAASGIEAFCERHFRVLAVLVLALAAFNVGFRLDREFVTAWDESLYATSAAEMVKSGNWLVTTFQGHVDYYNSKPPLNVWLIAASFKAFGINLWSLRLPSAIATWSTVAVLLLWTRRCFGALTSLLTSVVLSTTFAFLYVHSGRSGNPDAWLTLDLLLTVITLWSARTAPSRLLWLGPLAAVAFMLKGTAVLLPVAVIGGVLTARGFQRTTWRPLFGAAVLFLIPVGAWVIARWHFDRWMFFDAMVNYDLVARTLHKLEGHDHGWLYYAYILQKDHYDWLAAAVVLGITALVVRRQPMRLLRRVDRDLGVLIAIWAGATLLVPTVMATKLPWYLNLFYPVFAIGVAATITFALDQFALAVHHRERILVATIVIAAFALAEGKLVWYSFKARDLSGSVQGFFLDPSQSLEGRRVLQDTWDPADHFVLEHIAHGIPLTGNPHELAAAADEHDVLVLEPVDDGWRLTEAHDVISRAP